MLAVVTEREIKQGMEERYAKRTKETEKDRKLIQIQDSKRKGGKKIEMGSKE